MTLTFSKGVETLTLTKDNSSIADFTITGTTSLDASGLKMNSIGDVEHGFNVQSATFTANGITATIPEPATATLSLLALAGLAVRRRRK